MPPWDAVWDLLRHIVLPAFAAAAIVSAVVGRIGGSNLGTALGLIAGVALGFWLRNTLPLVPGDATWNRLPWAALAALVVERVVALVELDWSAAAIVRLAASFGLMFCIVPENVRVEHAWIAIAYGAAVWMHWTIQDAVLRKSENKPAGAISVGACLVLSFLVAGGVLLFAGIGRYMEAALVLAMAVAGVTVAAGWRQCDLRAVTPAVAVSLPGLLLVGNRETSVETIHWAAYALPALAPWLLVETIPLSHWPKTRLIAFRIALVLVPLIAAIMLARQGGSLDFGEPEW
jgi:hypothetical protein